MKIDKKMNKLGIKELGRRKIFYDFIKDYSLVGICWYL